MDILGLTRWKANDSAIGMLRVLLAGSLIVPVLLVAVLSLINYRSTIANATRDLERASELGESMPAEHSTVRAR
jgi:hypothetical protein